MKRIALDIILLISFFLMPWWFTLIYAMCLAFLFDSFFELLFLGLFTDAMFGYRGEGLLGLPLLYTFVYSIIFFVIYNVKTRLRQKSI